MKAPGKPCPVCGQPSARDFKPFCSRRCEDADLLHWLKGGYVIPAAAGEAEGDGAQTAARDGDDAP